MGPRPNGPMGPYGPCMALWARGGLLADAARPMHNRVCLQWKFTGGLVEVFCTIPAPPTPYNDPHKHKTIKPFS